MRDETAVDGSAAAGEPAPSRPAVGDWSRDWDHMDPRWTDDPFPIWSALRETCPIAHTERYRGAWLPTSYEAVRAIAYDTEHFSSKRVVVRENPPNVPLPSPPITSDPPHHKPARMLLLPAFHPKRIDALIPRTREICSELIEPLLGRATCDAAVEFAQHVPVRVIALMLGIPEDEGDRFRHWVHVFLQDTIVDRADSAQRLIDTASEMDDFFRHYVEARRQDPRDDLITFLIHAEHDGQPLTDRHLYGALRLLLLAGIDTTWSAIGSSLWHLAKTPSDRERLVAEPELMPSAVEEMLRAYAPVTMARRVKEDVTVGGCPMKAGEMVMLPFPAANRDPAMFPEPDKVILDREDNRHAAFGLGIHRCIGSNLARMEIQVSLEEWLKRIPVFSLDPRQPVTWSPGAVRGPRRIPVRIGT
jgi:cytochrome P450